METPKDGVFVADNVEVSPEGALMSRNAFVPSNVPDLPSSSFSGPIFSFWNPKEEKFDLLAICDGTLYLHITGTKTWDEVSQPNGAVSFNMSQLASYAQYGNLIVIADGQNSLAYFVVPHDDVAASVSRPGDMIDSNPLMTISDETEPPIESADYRAYYMISYVNDWGETPASGGGVFTAPAQFGNVKLLDDNQPLGKWSNKLKIDITGVQSALLNNTRVRIYRCLSPDFISPSITNYALVKEFQASDGDQAFEDDGSVTGRVVAPQLENSTGGLVGRFVTEIDGRLWALGAGKEFQKVYYTGAAPTDSHYPQFFSGDGGYFYVAYGTSFEPVTIKRGRADDGQICNFCLCAGPNGQGRRFNIFSLATTYGNQQVFQFYPSEQKGDEGAYSTFGVLDYMNSILYPSPGGFKSSGVRAAYTGDNITASIDTNIHDMVNQIPFNVFRSMYGTIYDGKAIWHVSPTALLVFDARVGGAWSRWTLSHSWFGSLSVNQDRVALYMVSGDKVLRYADRSEFASRDAAGSESPIRLASGRLMASPEDGREWIRLLNCLFVFSDLKGPIRILLRANSRRRLEKFETSVTVSQELFGTSYMQGSEPAPFGSVVEDSFGSEEGEFSSPSQWSDGPFIMSVDETAGIVEIRVRVNKDVNFLDWEIESQEGFLSMKLEEFVYEYVNIGVGLDFSSRYNEERTQITRN